LPLLLLVIVEGKINHLLRMNQDLHKGGETIVVGVKDFSVLRGIGCATGREKLARSMEPLEPTVIIHQALLVHRRYVEASGTTERCSI
jgi:hypothetical protein